VGLVGEFTQKVIGERTKNTFVAYFIDSGASAWEQTQELRRQMREALRVAIGRSIDLCEEKQFLTEVVDSWNAYIRTEELSEKLTLTRERFEQQAANIVFPEEETEEED
jgi:hypothetical protein